MSDPEARVSAVPLRSVVRRAVADVLLVDPEQVGDESSLIAELGAESIDFLDLIFRLEDSLDMGISIQDLETYLRSRVPAGDLWAAVTPRVLADFVRRHGRSGKEWCAVRESNPEPTD